MYRSKRIFDLLLCIIFIPLSIVFLAILFPITIVFQGKPFIYKQVRVGRKGKTFNLYKIRSMKNIKKNKKLLRDKLTIYGDPRITGIGYFLRKYKLDEIPQIFNILKGDMTFVGPRPEVPELLNLVSQDDYYKYIRCIPGVTDSSSIKFIKEENLLNLQKDPYHYYINILLPNKIRSSYEQQYKSSLIKDLIIIFKTFLNILK